MEHERGNWLVQGLTGMDGNVLVLESRKIVVCLEGQGDFSIWLNNGNNWYLGVITWRTLTTSPMTLQVGHLEHSWQLSRPLHAKPYCFLSVTIELLTRHDNGSLRTIQGDHNMLAVLVAQDLGLKPSLL